MAEVMALLDAELGFSAMVEVIALLESELGSSAETLQADIPALREQHRFAKNHRSAKNGVVHHLVEVGIEVAFRLLPELCVHPHVRRHPGHLVELDRPVHPFQTHALPEVELQVFVVDRVIFFVLQVRTIFSLFAGCRSSPTSANFYHLFLWRERVAVVRIVQLFEVLEVHLQCPPLNSLNVLSFS